MADRYFSQQSITSEIVELEGDEARHLARVMRAKPGDGVTLFDGSGAEFDCEITDVERNIVRLAVRERRAIDRELPLQLTLAVSLPKGDRQRWLVEKLTELGVRTLQPLRTERSVAQPSDKALERLRRAVIEASKQCGRNVLMEIAPAADWDDYVGHSDVCRADLDRTNTSLPASEETGPLRLVADPSGSASLGETPSDSFSLQSSRAVIVAVGPEGGFAESELAAARDSGWRIVTLGARILRVETAAVAASAAISLLRSKG